MAISERIEAFLKVRDGQRFKQSMKGAARSVRQFGEDTEATVAKLELLHRIDKKLERQGAALTLILERQARAVNDVGDEAVTSAAKIGLLSRAQRKLGRSTLGQIDTFKFWRNLLTFTRSEATTLAFTLGTYLSPAILELGASATAALMGGAAVGAGGLAALVIGLGGAALIAKTAGGQFKKVTASQQAYNLAVAQFGAGSKQAAAASARLYGVIQTQGGKSVWEAVLAVNALKTAWARATGGARRNLFSTLTAGVGAAQKLLPTFARETTRNTGVIRRALGGAFKELSGKEGRQNIVALSKAFRGMFGPLTSGGVDLLIALGRLLRHSAPYAVKVARAFAAWAHSIRIASGDAPRLGGFVKELVSHTAAWWRLTKAVGNTLRILFGGTEKGGKSLTLTLARVIEKFNVWLDFKKHTGALDRFFNHYNTALRMLFSDPKRWLDTYIPILSAWVANSLIPWAGNQFAAFGLAAGRAFIAGWWRMNFGAKLFVLAWIFKGSIFAAFGAAGKRAAGAFIAGMMPRLAAAFAAEGAMAPVAAALAGSLALALPAALIAAGLAGIVMAALLPKTAPGTERNPRKRNTLDATKPHGPHVKPGTSWFERHHKIRPSRPGSHIPPSKKAAGGTIPWGTDSWVGEHGPERARASAGGVQIMPPGYAAAGGGGLRSLEPMLSMSDMLPPQITILQVDGRELARAYDNHKARRKSRRGERP